MIRTTTARVAQAIVLVAILCVSMMTIARPVVAQVDEMQQRMAAVQSTERMLMGSGATSIDDFINERLSSTFLASMSSDEIRVHLTSLRDAVAGAGSVDLEKRDDDILLVFGGGANATVVLRIAEDEPGKIGYLALKEEKPDAQKTDAERMSETQHRRVRAVEDLGRARDDKELLAFIDEHVAGEMIAEVGADAVLEQLKMLRQIISRAGAITVQPEGARVRMGFRGSKNADVLVGMQEKAPYMINRLDVETDVESESDRWIEIAPITWDNLAERLREEADAGFSGTVLVVKDGKIVIHESYGLADRAQGRPNTIETIYGIGSTPIDFTRAAVLKLMDMGSLDLDDPITRFLDDVPADKASITIRHLMTGQSGLPNFHDVASDSDPDLAWIDRDEAVRRMMDARLLFVPGADRSHSHSAFVLLAAIVEVIAEETYPSFVRRHFFDPIGMKHTGFYGSDSGFKEQQYAVGYGVSEFGRKNVPLYWGPTSWLAMGSGGMVSTPGDMWMWLRAVDSGEIISEAAQESYWLGAVLSGGSDRGFFIEYRDDPVNTFILASNVHGSDSGRSPALSRRLAALFETGN